MPTLGQLTNPRCPNVGEPTLAQRKGWRWANVSMLAGMCFLGSYWWEINIGLGLGVIKVKAIIETNVD